MSRRYPASPVVNTGEAMAGNHAPDEQEPFSEQIAGILQAFTAEELRQLLTEIERFLKVDRSKEHAVPRSEVS